MPTMGALHVGHTSLIDASVAAGYETVVTIFVNPLQFGPNEDLSRYPRTLEADLELCRQHGAKAVFLPSVEEMYPKGAKSLVTVQELTDRWEGAHRPGHFDGVTTVVMKLFQIVQPDVAFFGAKDYQQQLVIRQMVTDLNLPVEIVTEPTVREPDGLAMSSRNRYLSAKDRQLAVRLSEGLQMVKTAAENGRRDVAAISQELNQFYAQFPTINVEYAALVDGQTLEPATKDCSNVVAIVAAKIGSTRLIDNMTVWTE